MTNISWTRGFYSSMHWQIIWGELKGSQLKIKLRTFEPSPHDLSIRVEDQGSQHHHLLPGIALSGIFKAFHPKHPLYCNSQRPKISLSFWIFLQYSFRCLEIGVFALICYVCIYSRLFVLFCNSPRPKIELSSTRVFALICHVCILSRAGCCFFWQEPTLKVTESASEGQ